jgi:ubiquitin C-terminal hydrolase
LNRSFQPNKNPFTIRASENQPNISFGGGTISGEATQKLTLKKSEAIDENIIIKESLAFEEDDKMRDEHAAMEAWKVHLQKNKSVVVDLFQGQLKSTVECKVCQHRSTKFDCLMYLSVPIAHRSKG